MFHNLQIFHIDDYEMEVLQKGHCPFCRVIPKKNAESLVSSWCKYDESITTFCDMNYVLFFILMVIYKLMFMHMFCTTYFQSPLFAY